MHWTHWVPCPRVRGHVGCPHAHADVGMAPRSCQRRPMRPFMTADDFRQLALSLPETAESAHMNHPDFRVKGKIFATLGPAGTDWGMVKLTPQQQTRWVALECGSVRPGQGWLGPPRRDQRAFALGYRGCGAAGVGRGMGQRGAEATC